MLYNYIWWENIILKIPSSVAREYDISTHAHDTITGIYTTSPPNITPPNTQEKETMPKSIYFLVDECPLSFLCTDIQIQIHISSTFSIIVNNQSNQQPK